MLKLKLTFAILFTIAIVSLIGYFQKGNHISGKAATGKKAATEKQEVRSSKEQAQAGPDSLLNTPSIAEYEREFLSSSDEAIKSKVTEIHSLLSRTRLIDKANLNQLKPAEVQWLKERGKTPGLNASKIYLH